MTDGIIGTPPDPDGAQALIEAQGEEIFARMKGRKPGVFSNITGQLMDWSMRNESLKVQLFRFVDVLPTLHSSREIARHAARIFGRSGWRPARDRCDGALHHSPKVPWLMAFASRSGVAQMGRTFILARNGRRPFPRCEKCAETPLAFTVDILGETAVSELEAGQYQARYLELIESLSREAAKWPPVPQIDSDDRGEIPRVNISVKLSALYSQIHPRRPGNCHPTHFGAAASPC